MRSKNKIFKKVLIIFLIIIICALSLGSGYAYYQLGRMKHNRISKKDDDLGIVNDGSKDDEKDKVINIALFGVDSGGKGRNVSHSDAIMILSIDEIHKKIKVSSLLRDSYVDIEGHGKTKINHSYVYGGPELAIKTLNQNFGLDIRDYVTVDFIGLSTIIDTLDGVEIEIKQSEIREVNKYMKEVAALRGQKPTPIKKAGLQTLNGNQATSYARIRHVGNGDFGRVERQQKVMSCLTKKIMSAGTAKYVEIATKLMPYIETSMTSTDIIKLSTEVVSHGISDFEWVRFPLDKSWHGETINGVWYLVFDIDEAKSKMKGFIYDDINPTKAPKENEKTNNPNEPLYNKIELEKENPINK